MKKEISKFFKKPEGETVLSSSATYSGAGIWIGFSVLSLIFTILYFYKDASGGSAVDQAVSVSGGILLEAAKHTCFGVALALLLTRHMLLAALAAAFGGACVGASLLATKSFYESTMSQTTEIARQATPQYKALESQLKTIKQMIAAKQKISSGGQDSKNAWERKQSNKVLDQIQDLMQQQSEIISKMEAVKPKISSGGESFVKTLGWIITFGAVEDPKKGTLAWAAIIELGSFIGMWIYMVGRLPKSTKSVFQTLFGEIQAIAIEPQPTENQSQKKLEKPTEPQSSIKEDEHKPTEGELLPKKDYLKDVAPISRDQSKNLLLSEIDSVISQNKQARKNK